jgi:hypothetical protein
MSRSLARSLAMSLFVLGVPLLTPSSEASPKVRQVTLQQVDSRRRLTVGIRLPGVARIRVRPSVEYRYRPK